MDTMVGVLVFGLGAAAFYTLMPVLSKGESISKYESVATQVAGRLIEHIQTMRPEDVTAANLERLNLIDQSCQKCHDIDNDAHWSFEKKWPKIAHPMER